MTKEVLWQLAVDSNKDMVPEDFFFPGGEDFVTESIDGDLVYEPMLYTSWKNSLESVPLLNYPPFST